MSVGQEHDSGADDPDLIRLNKRSLFTPSASVAVEQHSAVPHVSRSTYGTAKVEGRLTSPNARVPEIITQRCGGITVKGHTLKSFAYTTDAVIIRNTNANAILAVYPFTGEPVITQALLTVAQMPLFVGVGGGTTTGPRVAELAMVAEMQGAAGVVINAPAPAETIETTMSMVDIPVIATVGYSEDGDYNINADTAAGEIAAAIGAQKIVFITDVDGIYTDFSDKSTLVLRASLSEMVKLAESGTMSSGMIPKINACVTALSAGVSKAHIINGTTPHALVLEIFTDAGVGTMVMRHHDDSIDPGFVEAPVSNFASKLDQSIQSIGRR